MHSFSSSSTLVFPFLFWAAGWTLIDDDLRRRSWERAYGKVCSWYWRPLIPLGSFLILSGLLFLAESIHPLLFPFPAGALVMILVLLLLLGVMIGIYALTVRVQYGSVQAWKDAVRATTGPVEVNPLIAREQFVQLWCLLWLWMGTQETIAEVMGRMPSAFLSVPFGISVGFVLLGALLAFRFASRRRGLKRLEQRRFALAATWAPASSSAAHEGQFDPFIPPLSLRLKRTTLTFWLLLATLVGVLLSASQAASSFAASGPFQVIALLFSVGIIAFPACLILVHSLRARKTIEPTAHGLQAREDSLWLPCEVR